MVNYAFLCARFGAFYNGSFFWDLFSDVAMVFILRYFFASRAENTLSEVAREQDEEEAAIAPVDEDADFERAVELSLMEAKKPAAAAAAAAPQFVPQQQQAMYVMPIQAHQLANGQYVMMQPMYVTPQ
jgi:hypothetical protein